MLLIVDQPDIVAQFVATGLNRTFYPPFTAIGWVLDRAGQWRLVGGAVFNDYNGYNIEVSVYWHGAPLTRQPLREALRYVFIQCNCGRLTAKTMRSNVRMRNALPRLGFQIEAELKHFFGPSKRQNALIFRMDRLTAERWINGKRTLTAPRARSDENRIGAEFGQYADGGKPGEAQHHQSGGSVG